ncbi:MAG TPA: ABC transporter substrate-binding protein [Xanthobacteraceae bacterium]
MRRRDFITLLGGATAAWPLAARAQQSSGERRIGWLDIFPENDPSSQARRKAFLETMERLGWVVGRNLEIDDRWGLFDLARARAAGSEVLNLQPDLLLCAGAPVTLAMQQVTHTVPIVFTIVVDPVVMGVVPDLSHPGGNITGFSYLELTIGTKWLGLLEEMAPSVSRVALVFNPVSSPHSRLIYQLMETAAAKSAVQLSTLTVSNPAEIEKALSDFAHEPGGGIILSADSFLYTNRKYISELAARYRLPAIYGVPGKAIEGGLMYYYTDVVETTRQAAGYVDRILRGEKTADLPVQQPTKFVMSINLKAAKALDLPVPTTLLVSADEVIE